MQGHERLRTSHCRWEMALAECWVKDRSLFTGLGLAESPPSDGQEALSLPLPSGGQASNSWTLLQALLRQNEQARSYTTRLLLKKAREQPGIRRLLLQANSLLRRPPSMDRLHALLELWPMADREPLRGLTGLGQMCHMASGWRPLVSCQRPCHQAGLGSQEVKALRRLECPVCPTESSLIAHPQ